ncbi:MAG: DUF3459 domain-containing protein, partial [Actinomycetota bacterium]|nr:DUF3459 domain-containing protein [Actinomycetota bacterium]
VHRGPLRVAVNLADHTQTLPGVAGSVLLATDQATRIGSGLQLAMQSAAIVRVSPSFAEPGQ